MSIYCELGPNPLVPAFDYMNEVFVAARTFAIQDIKAFDNRVPGAYESELGYKAVQAVSEEAKSESQKQDIEMLDIFGRDVGLDVVRCLVAISEGRCSMYKSVEELKNG